MQNDHLQSNIVDSYGTGFGKQRPDSWDMAKAQRNLYMTLPSGYDQAHVRRYEALNKLADDSKEFKRIIALSNTVKIVHTGIGTVGGGAVGASTFFASLPAHAALGPFAAVTIPLHAAAAFLGPAVLAAPVARYGTRGLHSLSLDQARAIFRDDAHAIANVSSDAANERRGPGGAALRKKFGESGLNYLNGVMMDVDSNATTLANRFATVVRRDDIHNSYRSAGIPDRSVRAFYSRAEEIRVEMNCLA